MILSLEETMANAEQIKAAKTQGKLLRKAREEQGLNLAILASKLKFTVVEIVAIEDGNLHAFDRSLEKFTASAKVYAAEIGVDIPDQESPAEKIQSLTIAEWEIPIPHFLKKKD